MKKFTFTLQYIEATNEKRHIDLAFSILFWLLFCVSTALTNELNYIALLFAAFYTASCFIKPTKNTSAQNFGYYTLEFGESNLLYKSGDSIIWHIPFERVEKVHCNVHGSGKWFSPKTKELLVLTNDNDSYPLYGTIDSGKLLEIQNEIELLKSKNA
jgi:hypothetical protein